MPDVIVRDVRALHCPNAPARPIGLVSYYPTDPEQMEASAHEVLRVYQYAVRLVTYGYQPLWVCSAGTSAVIAAQLPGGRLRASELPPSCRYVVPCQAFTCAGVQLVCIDDTVWQQRSLHTRLFTMLCLLQQDMSCTVWHAFGDFPAPYLTIYAARFLASPAVVTCDRLAHGSTMRHPFEWQWVLQHASLILLERMADRAMIVSKMTEPATTPIRCVPHDEPSGLSTVVAWYQRLAVQCAR